MGSAGQRMRLHRLKSWRIAAALCRVIACLTFLIALLSTAASAQGSHSTTAPISIDVDEERLLVAPVSKNWRFHAGDDPNWANPGFDDSSWRILQPTENWDSQGFSAINNMAWFRFRIGVPDKTQSLLLLMPSMGMSYQVFSNGVLAGQAGHLPPEKPQVYSSAQRVFTLPLRNAQLIPTSHSKELLIAVRIWKDPRLAALTPNVLQGTVYVGSPASLGTLFSLSKAWDLLARGNDYTQLVISFIVGASTLLLFLLTRRDFYAWFTLTMLAGTLPLPAHLLSQHFEWEFFNTVYAYALIDLVTILSFQLFVLAAIGRLRWRLGAILTCLVLIAELGPIFFILGVISQTSADGIYLFASTLAEGIVIVLLIRAWRTNVTFIKLLLFPYALSVVISCASNLGHWLVDFNIPHASMLLTANVQVLREPFAVNVSDIGGVISTLGLLAVLVYQFAQSSREEQRLKSALQTAHDIQQSLVPGDISTRGGLHTEIVYLAAEEVGGDFCQVLPRQDGSTLIVIGDVSGKGLQAAMVSALAVGAIRSMTDDKIGPADTLRRLNKVLLKTPNRGFITCICMVITPSGHVILANAGHLSPYLNGTEVATPSELPLGIVDDIDYEQISFDLPAAARLTLLSDGVVEARSARGELYGFERTSNISRQPANEIAAAAHRFGQSDDITVITLDWQSRAAIVV